MISALGLLLIGLSPWALAPASADVTAPPATRLVKVMSFNTAVWNPDGSAIVPEVLREKPDIIVFVELGPRAVTSLPQLAADYPYGFLCSDRVTCNVAILSKLPIQSSSMRGPPGAPPLMRASFGPEIGGLTVVGVHLTRFPRAAMQFRQAEQLALMLKRIGGPQLVMGDFNATPFSQVLVRFAGATGLNRLTWLPSWPASFRLPQLAIDHIFVSDSITAVAGPRLGGYAGSDHYPIIATLAVPVGSAP